MHGGMERGAWRSYGEGGVQKSYEGGILWRTQVLGGASTTMVALWKCRTLTQYTNVSDGGGSGCPKNLRRLGSTVGCVRDWLPGVPPIVLSSSTAKLAGWLSGSCDQAARG